MRECRRVHASNLRALAIKENWFTKADNDTYSKWLTMKEDLDSLHTGDIAQLAQMVIDYSNLDSEMTITEVCFLIAKETYSVFFI